MARHKNKRSVDQKMVLFTDILDWVQSLFGSKVCERVQIVTGAPNEDIVQNHLTKHC